jgi:aminoglycoside phosphotransferase (APT) family kinase protein
MGTGEDSSGFDFDARRLDAYVSDLLGGPTGALRIERTQGGMSNPTYFLGRGEWEAVLRKQPGGVLVPSAHAIDREYRVLQALHASTVPVPKPLGYCDNKDVVGTPFYLMERLKGRVFHAYASPGLRPAERAAMFDSMLTTMATLHQLDYRVLGLADFGRPGNYFARQLKRWSQQWLQFRSGPDDIPALDRLSAWLSERVPESENLVLCHGDYRIGNLIFHAIEPRVLGVLDWELSTLGHPFVDLAYNTQAWQMSPDELGGVRGLPLTEMGIPQEAEYLERYYALTRCTERLETFHKVFGMFRSAVGSAGVAARGAAGTNARSDATTVGRQLAEAFAQRGLNLVEANP